ncbi:hypothetical protein FZC79_10285 [Rossellomorea vietnamensis]|uniref:Uncharacterized protein n=1 Tax=Rossellomorea vietnamensis TaxID=218284 RepID=A0A5D4KFG1_9BACI|nr:hypothetical protein [Rossellomorea vietnamensis]TYR75550.1 hypothetical protein FZC79_10285 [Rossellomorea vietnamensis]
MTPFRTIIKNYILQYKHATITELTDHMTASGLHTSENHVRVLVNYLATMEPITVCGDNVKMELSRRVKELVT